MPYRPRMDDLRAELDLLERRYGHLADIEDVTRLQVARQRHHHELDRVNAELDELLVRRRVTVDSIERLMALEREILRRAIDGERRRRREGWSPTPILGFRAWTIEHGHLHGAVEPWLDLTMEATCRTVTAQDEVPHSDGRCGAPACGIYALKRAIDIQDVTGWPTEHLALGMVALTGKVVEHALGYRAQRARIVALAVQHPDGVLFAPHPVDLWPILDGAGPTRDVFGAIDPYADMCQWLEAQKETHEWTSVNRTA